MVLNFMTNDFIINSQHQKFHSGRRYDLQFSIGIENV